MLEDIVILYSVFSVTMCSIHTLHISQCGILVLVNLKTILEITLKVTLRVCSELSSILPSETKWCSNIE